MDAPKCKICEDRHYGLCPPILTTNTRADKAKASADAKPKLERQLDPVKSAGRSGSKSTTARMDVQDNSTGPGARAKTADLAAATTLPAGTQAPPVDTPIPKPDRNKNRHRPGYSTEYMRDWRKGILRRSKPSEGQ